MAGTGLDSLFCWSLSARDGVPAPVRERASLPRDFQDSTLRAWRARVANGEQTPLLFLGTCHRVEVYGANTDPWDVLRQWEDSAGKGAFSGHAQLRTGVDVVKHLIRVASSLESEVLGETQITGQLREAADIGRSDGHLFGLLDWAVQQSLRAAKRIRTETKLGTGTVSVAHVAIDGLSDVFDDLSDKSAIVVGAGPMAIQALQRLHSKGIRHLVWANRTEQTLRDHPLSDLCEITTLDRLPELAWRHPVVVTATASETPLLSRAILEATGKQRTKCSSPRIVIDLGLPRNVADDVHEYKGFYVRNVDEFGNRALQNTERRKADLGSAEALLAEELQIIAKSSEIKARGPLVGELKAVLERLTEPKIAVENNQEFEYVPGAFHSKLMHRLIEELDRVGEPHATLVLESLVRAWRQPDQWLQSVPQEKAPLKREPPNLPPPKKVPPLPV